MDFLGVARHNLDDQFSTDGLYMKNLVIVLVVLALLVVGGKYYIEYSYKKELDQMLISARPMVDARYQDLKVGWDGSLSVMGIVVKPTELDHDISISKVSLSSSDRFLLLRGKSYFKDGKFPDKLNLSVDGMGFDSAMFDLSTDAKPCRDIWSSYAYTQIGLDRIEADAQFGFDFRDPYNASMNLYYQDDTGSLNMEWIFDSGALELVMVGGDAPLKEISLTANLNAEVSAAVGEYCAGVFKITPEDYFNKVIGSAKYSFNSFGVDYGPEFRESLVKFMQGGVQADLVMKPSKELLNMGSSRSLKSKDIIKKLNLTVSVDGLAIPIDIKEEEKPKVVAKPEKKVVYTAISVGEARNYVNKHVRIQRTKDRSPIEGRLLDVTGSSLAVEIYRYTGVMTYTVPKRDIAKIELYEVERVTPK